MKMALAKATMDWLAKKTIDNLEWTYESLNLHPKENVRNDLKDPKQHCCWEMFLNSALVFMNAAISVGDAKLKRTYYTQFQVFDFYFGLL